MYILPIAWLYVVLMMAVAEATNTTGTVLGAIITFLLYGLGPVALVVYLMGSPARKRTIKAREAADAAQASDAMQTLVLTASSQPNASGHTPADTVSPVRKEV
jgi:hypothetical protein